MDDRGRALYFHGRKKEIGLFQKLLDKAIKFNSGRIFLVQGAPGVGKTALLEKCSEIAKNQGWEVVEIEPDGLWNRPALEKYLGIEEEEDEPTGKERERNVDLKVIGGSNKRTFEKTEKSILEILSSQKNPLLLTLDEAQEMKDIHHELSPALRTAKTVLKKIHNGKCFRPLIFLVDGLGMTKSVFESFGISRFSVEWIIDLQKLDKISERAIITDWLVKEGKAKGDVRYWVDEITKHTYGWGQHITAYGEVASEQIIKDKGLLSKEGLNIVFREGDIRKQKYYKSRFHGFDIGEVKAIAKILLLDKDEIAKENIIHVLKEKYSEERANQLFDKALFKSIFHIDEDFSYDMPIPSMKTWLLSKLKGSRK